MEALEQMLMIPAEDTVVQAKGDIPEGAETLAILLHDSADSRNSRFIRDLGYALSDAGVGVVSPDLWTEDEGMMPEFIRSQSVVTRRVETILSWIAGDSRFVGVPLVIYGEGQSGTALLEGKLPERVRILVVKEPGKREGISVWQLQEESPAAAAAEICKMIGEKGA